MESIYGHHLGAAEVRKNKPARQLAWRAYVSPRSSGDRFFYYGAMIVPTMAAAVILRCTIRGRTNQLIAQSHATQAI